MWSQEEHRWSLCWLLYLGHQLPLPLPREELGPAKLETQTSGSCDNQSTLTLPHAKRRGVDEG